MRFRVVHALVRRSWWWVFGLCIATPAVALAVLGVGALRADDLERRNREREQQAQLVRLVDAALAGVLDRLAADGARTDGTSVPAGGGGAPSGDVLRFEVGRDDELIFPVDRIVGRAVPTYDVWVIDNITAHMSRTP